jgi:hypothetical protein
MADALLVKIFESFEELDEISPDDILVNVLAASLVSLYLLSEITTSAILWKR